MAAFAMYMVLGLQPAEARHYEISGNLTIPAIGLESDVTTLELEEQRLETPDTIVGSYAKDPSKVLLIGHSTTVFRNLNDLGVEDKINYNGDDYLVTKMETLAKDEINMNTLLAPAHDSTLVMMTCAGEMIGNRDATHRLIVTAVKI